MNKIPEYRDIEVWHLVDKIRIFGWLSDMMTEINPDEILEMHKDKIMRIKKYSQKTSHTYTDQSQHVKSEGKEDNLTKTLAV